MRTVFETSWRLPDPAEQGALAALSVFGGGCTLGAALEVAGTTPEVLVRLVDHSMIHLTPAGRYVLHPLIQQLAAAHLKDSRIRERHARHFADLLDQHATALQDGSNAEVTRVLPGDCPPELHGLLFREVVLPVLTGTDGSDPMSVKWRTELANTPRVVAFVDGLGGVQLTVLLSRFSVTLSAVTLMQGPFPEHEQLAASV